MRFSTSVTVLIAYLASGASPAAIDAPHFQVPRKQDELEIPSTTFECLPSMQLSCNYNGHNKHGDRVRCAMFTKLKFGHIHAKGKCPNRYGNYTLVNKADCINFAAFEGRHKCWDGLAVQ